MEQKKYGLIRLTKTDKPKTTLKKNIFAIESDSDDDIQSNSKRVNTSSGIKRQTQLDISRALTVDPNVFEYDSIYEEMKSQKESDVVNDCQTKEKQKPKYINNLLKFSEDRKKQNERRVERKVQKEREKEGNQFEDKEQFVTNAYKEKIKEMEAADQLEKRQEAIEELLDVKKQKDLSGFYRHLLNGDMSSNKDSLPQSSETSSKDISHEIPKEMPKSIPKPKTNRQIRRRRSSSEESSDELPQRSEIKEFKTEIIDKSKQNEKFEKRDNKDISRRVSETEVNESEEENTSIKTDSKDITVKKESDVQNNNSSKEEEVIKIPKLDKRQLLIKIFTKRTVGEAFTEAQMRYFQRKDNYVI